MIELNAWIKVLQDAVLQDIEQIKKDNPDISAGSFALDEQKRQWAEIVSNLQEKEITCTK